MSASHQRAYLDLGTSFTDDGRVSAPAPTRGRFGSNGYKVDGKLFAMLVEGGLAVKLPPEDIEAALCAKQGIRLRMGSRELAQWLVVSTLAEWERFAQRARAFVGDVPTRRRRG